MSKRAPGAGNVERTDSGRWRFRLRLPDGTRRASPPFDTEEEAERMLDLALLELDRGTMAPVGGVTLAGYGERWLERRTKANVETERGLWRHHVIGTELAQMFIVEIKRRHVREWIGELAKKRKLVQVIGGGWEPGDDRLSVQTQKLTLALLRCCLSAAVEDEIVTVNPSQGLHVEAQDEDLEDDWTFLQEDEMALVLGCGAIPLAARLHYQWAIGSGARQGESWGLRWQDIDLDGVSPQATLRRSYSGVTKAKKVRRFPLLPLALDALRRWRDIAPNTAPDALVWPSRAGGMRSEGDDYGWACKRRGKQATTLGHRTIAGITRRVTYHDLRHTCASHLVMGTWGRRWSLEEVCKFLGHSSITVTERYAHLAPGHLHRAAAETSSGGSGGLSSSSGASGPAVGLTRLPPEGSPPSVTAARLERATYCLGNSGKSAPDKDLGALLGQDRPSKIDAAQALLDHAEDPTIPAHLLDDLAVAVLLEHLRSLNDRQVQAALQVLQGGPHILLRAVKLAAEVVTEARALRKTGT